MRDWETAFEILRSFSDWPSIRRNKIREFYVLASQAKNGCIVELGTFRGLGAISLALGANDGFGAQVFTIDDRIPKQGWAGEPYTSEDERYCMQNIKTAGVSVKTIVGDSIEIAESWDEPVSLLVWDIGAFDRLELDFPVWEKHVVPSGRIAIKDIPPPGFGRQVVSDNPEWTLERECDTGYVYTYHRFLDRDY